MNQTGTVQDKWAQTGWRIEQKYANKVLLGNWAEERLQVGILSAHCLFHFYASNRSCPLYLNPVKANAYRLRRNYCVFSSRGFHPSCYLPTVARHPLITWSRTIERETSVNIPMLCPLCCPGIQTA
uniref:Uncharacterized protein n=1 Tax=Sander lucioperca TaxID=283035 RepID=A0A8D0A203_SANLU